MADEKELYKYQHVELAIPPENKLPYINKI